MLLAQICKQLTLKHAVLLPLAIYFSEHSSIQKIYSTNSSLGNTIFSSSALFVIYCILDITHIAFGIDTP